MYQSNTAATGETWLPLSPTETKLLALYDRGCSYKEISDALRISINTVKTYARRINVKTHADSLRRSAFRRRNTLVVLPG